MFTRCFATFLMLTSLCSLHALSPQPLRAQPSPDTTLPLADATTAKAGRAALIADLMAAETRSFELHGRGQPSLLAPKLLMFGGFGGAALLLSVGIASTGHESGSGIADVSLPATSLATGGMITGLAGGLMFAHRRVAYAKSLKELSALRQRRLQLHRELAAYDAAAPSTDDRGAAQSEGDLRHLYYLAELNRIDDQLRDIMIEDSKVRTTGPKIITGLGVAGMVVGMLTLKSALERKGPDPVRTVSGSALSVAGATMAAGGVYLLHRRTEQVRRRAPQVKALRLRKQTLLGEVRPSSNLIRSGLVLELAGTF